MLFSSTVQTLFQCKIFHTRFVLGIRSHNLLPNKNISLKFFLSSDKYLLKNWMKVEDTDLEHHTVLLFRTSVY